MKLNEIKPAVKGPLKFYIACQCAAYNYPNNVADKVIDGLEKDGAFEAKGAAAVKAAFPDIIKDITETLAKKKFDKDILTIYPDFYTDVTKIEITELALGIEYSDEDHDDEENDDAEDESEVNNFPRTGSNGQDYINIELSVFGADLEKIGEDKMCQSIWQIGMHIGSSMYGQYCDEVDVELT